MFCIVASICVSVWSESVVAEGHCYLQTSIKCCHVNIQGTHYSCNYMYLQWKICTHGELALSEFNQSVRGVLNRPGGGGGVL